MFISISSNTRASRPVGSSLREVRQKKYLLKDFVQLDDLGVRAETPECLDFSKVVYLLNCVEVVLHAFDGNVFASLDGLGLKDFGEGSLSFL